MTSKHKQFRVAFLSDGSAGDAGGIYPYSVRVCRALQQHNFSDEIDVRFLANVRELGFQLPGLVGKIGRRLMEGYTVATRREPLKLTTTRLQMRSFGESEIDLLHVPSQSPPVFGIPFICTMHDVQELHFPKFFSPQEREVRAIYRRLAINQAVRIIVSFDHVKQDLIKFFDCPEEKIAVIPIPYNQIKFQVASDATATFLSEKHKGLGQFFLYPAQTWEHKNHNRLISAFEEVANSFAGKISLVCTGKKNDYFGVIQERLVKSKFKERIHFLGLVPDEELHWLYKNTCGVVVPSLYEAGSFPLMEAMTLSSPVVCARTTSLPDTIGCEDFVFDPLRVDEMSLKMKELLVNESFAQASVTNSKSRVKELVAVETAKHYENLWLDVMAERIHEK